MSSIDSWRDLASKKKRNCLFWSTSADYPRTFSKRWNFWQTVHLWMHSIMPTRLKLNRNGKHILRPTRQVEHPIRSHQPTPTLQDKFRSWPRQSPTMAWITSRKTKGNIANNLLLGNDVIITIHHGMICQNAKLRRHFWRNYRHSTFTINPL